MYRIFLSVVGILFFYINLCGASWIKEDEFDLDRDVMEKKTTIVRHLKDFMIFPYEQMPYEDRLLTYNAYGSMMVTLDPYIIKFLDLCQGKEIKSVGEVGCAQGFIAKLVLNDIKRIHYTAADLCEAHLKVLEDNLTKKQKKRFTPKVANAITDQVFEDESLDLILMARVVHFFSPKEIKSCFKKLYKALKPGGRLIITSLSSYCLSFQKSQKLKSYYNFMDFFTQCPGYIPFLHSLCPEYKDIFPNAFHFLTTTVLSKMARQAGFSIHECQYYPTPIDASTFRYDGREHVGLIAVKPQSGLGNH